ncbi:MAG: hypothetical protein WC947_10470, partial [Elusimicrobiota bacterium]
MRKISWRLVISSWKLVFLFYLFTFSLSHFLFSTTPSVVKYQGVLKEKGVLVNGTKTIKFRITDNTGDKAYWSKDLSVDFTQGAFSCELELTGIDWGTGDYYLEVAIGGQILSPKEKIVSVVYALRAKDIDDGVVTTSKIADGAVTEVKISSISWTKLNNIPEGFADGIDNTGGTPGLNSIGSYEIIDSTITNADISPTAAIAYSKLNLVNQILTGDIKDGEITASDLNQSNVATVFLTTSSAVSPGAINTGTNPLEWTKLKNVPSDIVNGASVDSACRVSTGTLVMKAGDTMTGDLNSAYKIIGSTIGNTNSKLYGDGSSLTGTSAVDTACRISTGNIQTELDSVELDTGTLRTDLTAETNNRISADNEIKISTGALRNEVITSTASLVLVDRNLATSTGTLDTNKLDKSSATVTYVFKSGDTMTGDLNSNYKIIGSTIGDSNSKLYGNGSALTGLAGGGDMNKGVYDTNTNS